MRLLVSVILQLQIDYHRLMDAEILIPVSELLVGKFFRAVLKHLAAIGILEKRYPPRPCHRIMLQNVKRLIPSLDFKLAIIRPRPAIQNLNDINPTLSQPKTSGRFLTAMAGIAGYANFHVGPSFRWGQGVTMVLSIKKPRGSVKPGALLFCETSI
jgi:hypothetical protein